jgi:phosphatidylinositol-3-phosphatase
MKRAAMFLCAIALLGCESGGESESAPAAAAASKGSHVFVIVMENKEHGDVIGSPSAPFTTSLARRYASLKRMYGVRHPSLPNYFALTAGTTFGVHTDCTTCQQSGRSIADQLEEAGVSWKAYLGGMPRACFKGAFSGRYAKKHNPFMYYRSVAGSSSRCRKVVPEGQLSRDLRAGKLPTFSFLAPDLCDDTHDCPVDSGDRYLSRVVPSILRALGPDGYLVLTYDEGTTNAHVGGRIPTVIAGTGVRRGSQPSATYNHYSLLRLIEDSLRLPRLGHAGDVGVRSLGPAFKSGVPRLR